MHLSVDDLVDGSWEMYWFTKSCFILPEICSGDHRSFNFSMTYRRMSLFFSLVILPRDFRFFRARSCTCRGVYRSRIGVVFFFSSREIERGLRPSSFAMFLIDFLFTKILGFFHVLLWIDGYISYYFNYIEVLRLLVELRLNLDR